MRVQAEPLPEALLRVLRGGPVLRRRLRLPRLREHGARAVGRSQQARKPDAEVLRGASAMCFVRSSSPPPPPPSVTPPDGRASSPRNVVEGAPKVPGLERIVSLERAASLHLDTPRRSRRRARPCNLRDAGHGAQRSHRRGAAVAV